MQNSKIFHPYVGSISELGKMAIPLMLNNLSNNMMLFFDRIIISHSSIEEMNAAVTIGIACSVIIFAISAIASTAEIFVGRFHGSHHYSDIGKSVWQMIWFSLTSFIFFIPLGLFAENIFIPAQYHEIGISFFHWYTFGGPAFALVMALSAFYIGRGHVKLVTFTMILSNIVNLILAAILVLGIPHWFSGMGMKGAAIATISAQLFQAGILFIIFLSKNHHILYKTRQCHLDIKLYLECLKVGIPLALGYMIEVGAWALLLRTLTVSGNTYIAVFAIGQSLFVLFTFISEGMQKSITVIVSNLIGAKKWEFIPSLVKSAVILHIIFAVLLAFVLFIFSDTIILSFTSKSSTNDIETVIALSQYTLIFFLMFFIFDGIKWIMASILIALKRTISVMLINFASVWLVMVIPTCLLIGIYHYPPLTVWKVVVMYSFINALLLLIYWKRFVKYTAHV